jgi:septum formation protein
MFPSLQHRQYVLASQSPRRRQLLSLLQLPFTVIVSGHDENGVLEPDPINHVLRQSLAKAREVIGLVDDAIIIGADTIVVLDGEILGKPTTHDHAVEMLTRLSGRTHHVFTGFSLIDQLSGRSVADYDVTAVHFRPLQEWEIKNYVASDGPMDKAGAYGIQDQSAVFADRIEGCFYNVVGFPLTKFYLTLVEFLNNR